MVDLINKTKGTVSLRIANKIVDVQKGGKITVTEEEAVALERIGFERTSTSQKIETTAKV